MSPLIRSDQPMNTRVVVVGLPPRPGGDLVDVLTHAEDITVAATADSAATATMQAERIQAHVVLITASVVGVLADTCDALHAVTSQPRILVFDGEASEDSLLEAIEAGVDGYVVDSNQVSDAVRTLARGETVIPPNMLGALLRRLIQSRRESADAAERLVKLTRREREILSLLVEGFADADITRVLFISPETVRTHVQRILRKLGVHSRKEAITLVQQTGLADRLERIVDRSTA